MKHSAANSCCSLARRRQRPPFLAWAMLGSSKAKENATALQHKNYHGFGANKKPYRENSKKYTCSSLWFMQDTYKNHLSKLVIRYQYTYNSINQMIFLGHNWAKKATNRDPTCQSLASAEQLLRTRDEPLTSAVRVIWRSSYS